MQRIGRKLLLVAGAAAAAAALCRRGRRTSLKVVPSIELSRYVGLWFEIAHLPAWFQRDCASDTTATYTLRPDGKIAVLNQCRTLNGRVKAVRGTARAPAPREPNSKLKVSFFWPFSGDYWVIDLDPDYGWAVVGEPRRRYLWILGRRPQMDPDTFDGILQRAKRQGYALDRLVRTRHTLPARPGQS